MSEDEVPAVDIDPSWLNDSSEFQLNVVSRWW
jgi:hypothetical protein